MSKKESNPRPPEGSVRPAPPPPPLSTQGSRDNSDKPAISMVMEAPAAVEGIARVLMFGEKKYSRANWKKGLKVTEIIDSMQRHVLRILAGEDIDQESGLPHADHIGCNALFLSEMMATRPDMDDRPVVLKAASREEAKRVSTVISPGGLLK